MKQYREPVTRLSKEVLESITRARKEQKLLNRFGFAHFPKGTVAVFESPTLRYLGNGEGKFVGQKYETFEAETLGVISNGPDSWVVVLNKPCNIFENNKYTINVSWAREIIKRGDGPLLYMGRSENTKSYHNLTPPVGIKKHHSQYYIDSVMMFVQEQLVKRFNNDMDCTHLFDIEQLMCMMSNDLYAAATKRFTPELWGLVINKKKFHRILNRHLPRARVSRHVTAREQEKRDAGSYAADMVYLDHTDDYDHSDYMDEDFLPDMIDDEEPTTCEESDSNEKEGKTLGDLIREAMEKDNTSF